MRGPRAFSGSRPAGAPIGSGGPDGGAQGPNLAFACAGSSSLHVFAAAADGTNRVHREKARAASARVSSRQRKSPSLSGRLLKKAELHERGNTVVEPDLFQDFAVLHPQDRNAGEMHLAP